MIRIDGSQGEGGGQVLRTALTLAILTGHAIELYNIRAGRRNPGLAPQHLAGVVAAAQICQGETRGVKLRSTEIGFIPGGPAQAGQYIFDISRLAGQGSAGAVTLLLQTILLPLALAEGESQIVLRGGTHVAWSPPVHYVKWVLLRTLAQAGLHAKLELITWGWYPQGGGEIHVSVQGGAQLQGLSLLERGELVELKGLAAVSNLPAHIPQRIASRANSLLRDAGLPGTVEPLRTSGPSTGAGLFTALKFEKAIAGFSALGDRGKPSEVVASEAIEALSAYQQSQAALDRYLPDQLLPTLALAKGPSALSTVEITQHTLTNIAIIGHFVERRIAVEGREGEPGIVRVEGSPPALS